MANHSPLPWEVIPGNDHHGPYIVTAYGTDICDLYAMSNPECLSVRNGGVSKPISFTDAEENAAYITAACNAYPHLVARIQDLVEHLGNMIGHARWVAGEFDIHYAHLDAAVRAYDAAIASTPTSPTPQDHGQNGGRS